MYRQTQRQGVKEDGKIQDAEFMDGEENVYLEDKDASGFVKYYKDQKYAFVALLPNEGVDMDEYIKGLNGENLNRLLTNPTNATVKTSIPKFETEFEVEMSDVLREMGMTDAFHEDKANFVEKENDITKEDLRCQKK